MKNGVLGLQPKLFALAGGVALLLPGTAEAAEQSENVISRLSQSTDAFFVMLGAVMILAMHGGFAFLEVGSVRKKNQVNALNKIICEWGLSTIAYLVVGYGLSRGIFILTKPINEITSSQGIMPMKFFLFLGFAACIPAIISGGVAERSKFWTNSLAGIIFVALIYPICEGLFWGSGAYIPVLNGWLEAKFGAGMHDFAGSAIVHATGGWLALPAIIILGPRIKRYDNGNSIKVSSIPFLALGSWILIVGWFGFNVMSAGQVSANADGTGGIQGLVAINSLLAMVGGTIAAMLLSRNDAGFVHNGALAGLVAICAGSDIYHPISAIVVGAVAGAVFVILFEIETEKWKIDDVLGVWPLHGVCGAWGGIAVGIFGNPSLGASVGAGAASGVASVSFMAQLISTLIIIAISLVGSLVVYGTLQKVAGIRLDSHAERIGADLSIHLIEANPEEAI